MEIRNFTSNQFNKLSLYELPKEVTAIESQLYFYRYLNQDMLLKKYFRADDSQYIGNKLLTISLLLHYKEQINIPQLILPEKLVSIDNVLSGFIMRFLKNNVNLSTLLYDKNIDMEEKIKLLKSSGKIIQAVHHVDPHINFFLGDIHESNFVYHYDDKTLYGVDLDGCKIGNNETYSIRYCSFNEKLYDLEQKYPMDENDDPIANYNTDWYCYATMILNTIGQGKVYKLLIDDLYDYLQYLKDCGIGTELIDYFANLYTLKKNTSPVPLLNEIPKHIERANIKVFAKVKNLNYI